MKQNKKDEFDCIIPESSIKVSAKEKWLFENKDALESIKRGLKNSAEGKVKNLGSFSKYTKGK